MSNSRISHQRIRVTGVAAVVGTSLLVAACSSGPTRDDPATPADLTAATSTANKDADQTDSETAGPETAGPERTVPRLVGLGMAAAQDRARKAGFRTTAHDASGQYRLPITARAWKVCFQQPADGQKTTEDEIAIGAVRLREGCPRKDVGANRPTIGADKKLPNFVGRNLQETMDTLGRNASVQPVDVSGQDRQVLRSRNWQICKQTPAPGTKWEGEPLTFDVVQYGETCP